MRTNRPQYLRTLNRFDVYRHYDVNTYETWFTVRPKGFETVLFEVRRPTATSKVDFADFMNAVTGLCEIPAPPKR